MKKNDRSSRRYFLGAVLTGGVRQQKLANNAGFQNREIFFSISKKRKLLPTHQNGCLSLCAHQLWTTLTNSIYVFLKLHVFLIQINFGVPSILKIYSNGKSNPPSEINPFWKRGHSGLKEHRVVCNAEAFYRPGVSCMFWKPRGRGWKISLGVWRMLPHAVFMAGFRLRQPHASTKGSSVAFWNDDLN